MGLDLPGPPSVPLLSLLVCADHFLLLLTSQQQQQQQQETPEELLDTKPDNSLSSIQNNNNNDELMQSYHQLDVKEEPEEDHSHKKANSSTTSTTTCAGCGLAITDRYYLVAVDKVWHSECLRCDECSRPLDTALSCFVRQSRIYCREDYQRYSAKLLTSPECLS